MRSEAVGLAGRCFPESVDDIPRLAEAGRIGRAHLGSVGVAPVESSALTRVPMSTHIVVRFSIFPVDFDADQLDAAHHGTADVDAAESAVCRSTAWN